MKSEKKFIVVSIIMGSDSDLSVMQEAAVVLEEFAVSYELSIVSAHRTPERMMEYSKSAYSRGIKVIIAGAGGAAHLPGMVAALTSLPVIGVPVQSRAMSGLDSLYSIVQMPPGVPVATMAINGAKNAALFAVKILATADEQMMKKMIEYQEKMKDEVVQKAKKIESIGFHDYFQNMKKG